MSSQEDTSSSLSSEGEENSLGGSSRCHFCKESGHIAKECKQKRFERVKRRKCFICGKEGHNRRECPGVADGGSAQSIHRNVKGGSKAKKIADLQAPKKDLEFFDSFGDLGLLFHNEKHKGTLAEFASKKGHSISDSLSGCITCINWNYQKIDGFKRMIMDWEETPKAPIDDNSAPLNTEIPPVEVKIEPEVSKEAEEKLPKAEEGEVELDLTEEEQVTLALQQSLDMAKSSAKKQGVPFGITESDDEDYDDWGGGKKKGKAKGKPARGKAAGKGGKASSQQVDTVELPAQRGGGGGKQKENKGGDKKAAKTVIEEKRPEPITERKKPVSTASPSQQGENNEERVFRIYGIVGVPPTSAHMYDEEMEVTLKALVGNCRSRIVAWGPIGLDFSEAALFNASQEHQISVFERQIKVAVELGLPLVVRMSEPENAEMEAVLIKVLEDSAPLSYKMYFSSYRGSEDFFVTALKRFPQAKFGFGGRVTFSREKLLHNLAFDIPLDRLLLESSSPHSPPTESQLGNSHPGVIPWVVQKIAELKKVEDGGEEIYLAARENVTKFFGV